VQHVLRCPHNPSALPLRSLFLVTILTHPSWYESVSKAALQVLLFKQQRSHYDFRWKCAFLSSALH